MKFGLCVGLDLAPLAKKLGYDYAECALNGLAEMDETVYRHQLAAVRAAGIPVIRCNCLLPWDMKVTGPDASEEKQRAYLDKAFARAKETGIEVAVFGNGGARKVPEGWDFARAWRQIADFLKLLGEYGDRYGIAIAIEPLRRMESNILNLVSEATALAALTDHPRIGVLGDTYHMLSSHEPMENLQHAGSKLLHVHISHALEDLSGRIFPAEASFGEHAELFQVLKNMDYQGSVSVEAGYQDLEKEGAEALRCLKKYLA